MKEALVANGPKVTIHDVSIPKPNANQVLIQVIVSGSNPKDWKRPKDGVPHNSGDDIAGIVAEVGANVTTFKKGDRVAAFHEILKPGGSYAEFAIAWEHTTFHLPEKISFEEGATIPLTAMTAAVGLYLRLGLPEPWRPATGPTPLIIYGASGAVGAFAVKLARLSNIHPIICVAGRAQNFVESLIDRSKGDTIIDYRQGDEALVSAIKEALKNADVKEVKYAFDCISQHGSFQTISKALAKDGSKITLIIPGRDYSEIPDYIERSVTFVGVVHADPPEDQAKLGIRTGSKEFGLVFFRLFTRGLQEGWLRGHPYEIIPGGLGGIEKALTDLQNGVASGTKYVFKIGDTK